MNNFVCAIGFVMTPGITSGIFYAREKARDLWRHVCQQTKWLRLGKEFPGQSMLYTVHVVNSLSIKCVT